MELTLDTLRLICSQVRNEKDLNSRSSTEVICKHLQVLVLASAYLQAHSSKTDSSGSLAYLELLVPRTDQGTTSKKLGLQVTTMLFAYFSLIHE